VAVAALLVLTVSLTIAVSLEWGGGINAVGIRGGWVGDRR